MSASHLIGVMRLIRLLSYSAPKNLIVGRPISRVRFSMLASISTFEVISKYFPPDFSDMNLKRSWL